MNTTNKQSAGRPSKQHGKKSGGGRDNESPKSNKAHPTPRKQITQSDVDRIHDGKGQDKGFPVRAQNAVDRRRGKAVTR
ncbi:hypothetical protein [Thioclava sp. F36-6]|uniref:hypothetical protein n=1 Tax=Thioclava sp. F36-6 TaxID=1915316 RepID=UPI0011BAA10E|nr:hypothetical protein [Thioclava sp. F36-6]